MNKAVLSIIVIFGTAIFIHCVSKSENDKIKKENESLKSELEELKFGAEKLYKQAKKHYNEKDYNLAKSTIDTLFKKHPEERENIIYTNLHKRITFEIEKTIKEKERTNANAVIKMQKQRDDFQKLTWYKDKTSPLYVNRDAFYLYFAKYDNSTRASDIILKIQYCAEDWLFISHYSFFVDGKTFTLYPDEIKRDSGYERIWEWSDHSVDTTIYKIVDSIVDSKIAKIRFQGEKYNKDKYITEIQKNALKNVINAYEALGGGLSIKINTRRN